MWNVINRDNIRKEVEYEAINMMWSEIQVAHLGHQHVSFYNPGPHSVLPSFINLKKKIFPISFSCVIVPAVLLDRVALNKRPARVNDIPAALSGVTGFKRMIKLLKYTQ